MHLQVVDNVSMKMDALLSKEIEAHEDIRIAVAYVSKNGVQVIEKPLNKAIESGSSIELLIGLDTRVTEPDAVLHLHEISVRNSNFLLFCHAPNTPGEIYHPKLYLFKTTNNMKAVVGSSNLTRGGLKTNIEVNLLVSAQAPSEIVSDLYGAYNRLKFHKNRVVPDDEFLGLYRQVFEDEKDRDRRLARDEHSKRLKKSYQEKLSSLNRPKPTKKDLVGWLELVYDSLPEGDFTNSDVYKNEGYYREYYPDNQNIRAKVRQQLQVLDRLGFIKHLGRARWRKL